MVGQLEFLSFCPTSIMDGGVLMFFILYNQAEEMIYQDIDQVAERLVLGWTLYGYSDNEKQAEFLLHECRHC